MKKVITMMMVLGLLASVSYAQFNTGSKTASGTISWSKNSYDGEEGMSILIIAPSVGYFVNGSDVVYSEIQDTVDIDQELNIDIPLIMITTRSEIILSELCDPRSNYATDRFIEIYNSGTAEVDLTGWQLVAIGNSADIFTWNLSGSISPDDALVAGDLTLTVAFPVDFPDEGWSDANGTWNGKSGDGAKLINPGGTIVDIVTAGGSDFENADLVRNPDISAPNPTYTPSEWTSTAVSLPTDGSPGTHIGTPVIPGPAIANIMMTPDFPIAGDAVTVTANITDSVSAIASVKLMWDIGDDSLTNEIPMSVTSGETYSGDQPIPAQPEGTTVYFMIVASDSAAGSAESDVISYSIHHNLTIREIQGQTDSSPYDGSGVITSGIVTAVGNDGFVLQDGSGPRNGIWVQSTETPASGDSLTLRGIISEDDNITTLIVDAIMSDSSGFDLPDAVTLTTNAANSEDYEGVLILVENAACQDSVITGGQWNADDGSGSVGIGNRFYSFKPLFGSSYTIRGPLTQSGDHYTIEPRDSADVIWVGDNTAPLINSVSVINDTTLLLTFSEAVETVSAETITNYHSRTMAIHSVSQVTNYPNQVLLTVSAMSEGLYAVTVNGVQDLYGNAMVNVTTTFSFIAPKIPEGYYESAENLNGEELRAALHEIIKDHEARSYDYAWTAFYTTDVKPNGKVWDIYSDIPGGTPPYEYTFGTNEGGIGGQEGNGYTREHSFPKSWFGGTVMPMYTDIFALYPCDAHVNGNRGVYPYGEVSVAEWTSLNGSKRGQNTYPGYSGIVFEPIDAYKGDLARTYFYMTTRYYTEDEAWPGSPMVSGANLLPWAESMMLEWHAADPVSRKEIDRNNAIYEIQKNRNPYIDHPEYLTSWLVPTAIDAEPTLPQQARLENIFPNPFNSSTTIEYFIPQSGYVTIALYNLLGQKVADLVSSNQSAGTHHYTLDASSLSTNLYLCRFQSGTHYDTQKLMLMK